MRDFNNSKYSKQYTQEQLDSYSEKAYKSAEEKMDQILLCNVSEQRCRPLFCSYQNCLASYKSGDKCLKYYRMITSCVEKERRKVIFEFLESGRQPKH